MKLGVCWYPDQWPETLWADDVRRMADLGLSFVRLGEFGWSRMEPSPGQFDWAWLDRALDLIGSAGLQAVLGTPTACPPKWLVDAHPEILARDRQGRLRQFGSRRHYCFSSDVYLEQACRITQLMADRYGQHPAVTAWQTDNEYGCHDTVVSTSDAARAGFRQWLQAQYGDVAALNAAWGLSFWAQEYRDFSEVDPPFQTVTESHPAHRLAWQRYSSAMVQRFNAAQVAILRAASPGRDIIHNFMGLFTEFDHFAVAQDLDVATWDSYPLGFLQQGPFPPQEKQLYLRLGHPDLAAFHHDLYRGVGRGRWWVIEQQPGPVNWAPWNPAPAAGAIALWAWEALAHGAERVAWFRWRQAPTGQEAMHAGLLRPDDQPAPAFAEVAEVAKALQTLGPVPENQSAKVALLFDYDAIWGLQAQPQGKDYDGLALAMEFYGAACRLGLDVDVLPVTADLTGYALVLLPAVLFADAALGGRLAASGATVLAGPRTGAKTRDFAIPPQLPPDGLQSLIDLKVTRVESLPPGISIGAGNQGCIQRWMEDVEGSATPLRRLDDGRGLLWQQGRVHYLAGWPDAPLLDAVMADMAASAGLHTLPLPPHTRLRRRGAWHFLFNFGAAPVTLPPGLVTGPVRLGQQPVPSGGVLMWEGQA